jgi:hypothetical protein
MQILACDRTPASRRRLERLHTKIRVIQYPKSERHFQWTRHDHGAVLNRAVMEAVGLWICLFDSDAHPIRKGWVAVCEEILQTHDAIAAADIRQNGWTHPCFMVLQKRHIKLQLQFDAELFINCTDTGRLIGKQLREKGERVYLATPSPAFLGYYGDIFLGIIYHHGKGSFSGVDDPLVQNQISGDSNYFRNQVLLRRNYQMTDLAWIYFAARRVARKLIRGRSSKQ